MKKIINSILVGIATFCILSIFFLVIQIVTASQVKEKFDIIIGFPFYFVAFNLNDNMEYRLNYNWKHLGLDLLLFCTFEYILSFVKQKLKTLLTPSRFFHKSGKGD
jgi:hypothetical protein